MRRAEAQRYPPTDIEMRPGGLLEVQNRARAVGVEPEESLAYPPVSRRAMIGEPIP
jgi:hypothetical protein